jgi:uncharacterized protein YndB with AHSA1/START domain
MMEKAISSDREIKATRLLNAPRELVWKVFTEPDHIAKWWGPKGFTNTIHQMDVRVGGIWKFIMHGPDGTNYPNESVFLELVKPQRIVFRHSKPDFTATITFEEEGGQTKLTWRMLFDSGAVYEGIKKIAVPGLQENLVKLEAYLKDSIHG